MDADAAGDRAVEIRIENVHKAFAARPVLRGVDLTVYRGDCLAIVGGSGCGKTVLLNHILGQLRPDTGRVYVADHSEPGAPLKLLDTVDDTDRDEIHVHWGVVFQRNALFSGTVYDNIALWLKEVKRLEDAAILPIARRALADVALPTDDEFLRRNQEQLSGGMAKRLAVARALAMDPAVLFYDEPTTGLDPTSSAQIHDLIHETHHAPGPGGEARTTIIITHDKDLLSRLEPRTVMLHEGRVFFDGPFAGFHASTEPVIRPYFEVMPILHAAR
ncbi:MAG: ATP-binding cassette domain-containing protein [Gammaproteobacteria bacterium]|nr:ATP-binding cassette domain-containing protein [Gammaproteobacteria bacterium]